MVLDMEAELEESSKDIGAEPLASDARTTPTTAAAQPQTGSEPAPMAVDSKRKSAW
jgi:hypothetical protein